MPVFDFAQEEKDNSEAVKTYTTFQSDESQASPEKPIIIIEDKD